MSLLRLSTVAIGRAYEVLCQDFLRRELSMPLILVGGANDNGIDLRGTWRPSLTSENSESTCHENLDSSSIPPSPPLSVTSSFLIRSYAIIAQCKCYSKKLGPSVIRELEGTATSYMSDNADTQLSATDTTEAQQQQPLLALLLSRSPFSQRCIARATFSNIPILLLNLEEVDPILALTSSTKMTTSGSALGFKCLGALPNPAFHRALKEEFKISWNYNMRSSRTPASSPSFHLGRNPLRTTLNVP